MIKLLTIAAACLALGGMALFEPAFSDDRDGTAAYGDGKGNWGVDDNASSAALARDGWKFLAMSTLSWPDGRQAIVTMWQSRLGDHARCYDYFDAAMRPAGGKCERSGTGI